MPNIAPVLREEIVRLARKEIRRQTQALSLRAQALGGEAHVVCIGLGSLGRDILEYLLFERGDPALQVGHSASHLGDVFAVLGRHRLENVGLSAANYGKLVGVTGQTIYSWEQETSRPRKPQVARIAALRHMGKREAHARLAQLMGSGKKK